MPTLIRPVAHTAPAVPPQASDKAMGFLRSLLADRSWDALSPQMVVWATLVRDADQTLPARQCSQLIDALKKAPYAKSRTYATPKVSEGVYLLGDQYVKVQPNQAGTSLYAKIWEGGHWAYAPGLVGKLTPEMVLTAEQAKEFGDRHHRCVYCSLQLTDQRSIDAGYGPICASNYGLPWGD